MKIKIMAGLVGLGLALALPLTAVTPADPETTINGLGACAKCTLKKGETCQQTITTEAGNVKVTYYLAQNDVAKKFGNQFCTEKKKVKATGTVKIAEGKHELTASKIELVTN